MQKTLRSLLLSAALFAGTAASAQLQPGDLAITGLNSDGNDDLSMVALATIPANTTLYFRDDEWSGTAWVDANEGNFSWNSGTSAIAAGTIINFSGLGAANTLAVNVGTVAPGTSANYGFGAGDEAVFVYTGTNVNTPTTFICALGKGTLAASFGSLVGTGLSEASTAPRFATGIDIAAYTGPRTGLTKAGYQSALAELTNNWISQDGSGDQSADGTAPDVPFSTLAFSFGMADVTPPAATSAAVVAANQVRINFSEAVSIASATNTANYQFTPALSITNVAVATDRLSALLTTANLTSGTRYSVVVNNLVDTASPANTQTVANSLTNLYFNNYSGTGLVITELMYNPGTDGDSLEFVEIHNATNAAIAIGGLRLTNGIDALIPERSLAAGGFALMAQDTGAARRFYNQTFTPFTGALSNGGEAIVLKNFLGNQLDSVNYDDVAPWPLTPDGTGPSLELINPASDNNVATNWRASATSTGKQFAGNTILASPGTLPVVAVPTVAFARNAQWVTETADSARININVASPNALPVIVRINALAFSTATSPQDYEALTIRDTIPAGFAGARQVRLNLNNDNLLDGDRYVVLAIDSLGNGTATAAGSLHTLHLLDDERQVPTASGVLGLSLLTSYKNGVPNTNSAEIVAYHPTSKRLFIANSIANRLNIVNFANPAAPVALASIDLSTFGGINSVAVQGNVIVAAVESATKTANGQLLFLDTLGNVLKQITTGVLPDMVGISPDGKYVVTANEAEPETSYLNDPEGSVTIVDISGGVTNLSQANATTVSLASLNPLKASLRASGVRIFGRAGAVNDGSTVAQDLEPEYVTFSSDSKRAYITMQENNALLVIDLDAKTIATQGGQPFVKSLGTKDHSLAQNSLDASDQADSINMVNWRIRGVYMPDAITGFRAADGKQYFITANEGDAREYTGLEEVVKIGAMKLDPAKFPDSLVLRQNGNLGRLDFTNASGDTDGDGDFDELHAFGSRSFTIWDSTGTLVWDSKNELENILRSNPDWRRVFNTNNTGDVVKNRSDNKGPEPEGVAVGTIGGRIFAFVALERSGGVMVYEVTNPQTPQFVTYAYNRQFPLVLSRDDMGPEGIVVIPAQESPNGKTLVLLANEISSSISVYEVNSTVLPFQLVQFGGRLSQGQALLQWTISGAEEAKSFVLEHSSDGRHFSALARYETNGLQYSHVHGNLAAGQHFYRLVTERRDGRTERSQVVVLQENGADAVRLMQNPVTNQLRLQVQSQQAQTIRLRVANAQGQVLITHSQTVNAGSQALQLPTSQLAAGLYYLVVEGADRNVQTLPFTKQ